MNLSGLAAYQKELTIAAAEVVTFGTAVTPLLLTVQQQWRPAAVTVTVILGILGVAKTLYGVLTGPAVQAAKAPPPSIAAAPDAKAGD